MKDIKGYVLLGMVAGLMMVLVVGQVRVEIALAQVADALMLLEVVE